MHSGTDLEMREGMRSEEQEELEIASEGHSLPKWTYAIQYPGNEKSDRFRYIRSPSLTREHREGKK